jgi:hypothetical protein
MTSMIHIVSMLPWPHSQCFTLLLGYLHDLYACPTRGVAREPEHETVMSSISAFVLRYVVLLCHNARELDYETVA